MKAYIIPAYKTISIDGKPVVCDFTVDSSIKSITWEDGRGVIQHNDGTPNKLITDISEYSGLVGVYWSAYAERYKPSRFHTFDSKTKTFSITPENQAILNAEQQAAVDTENEKQAELSSNPISGATFGQADQYIDNNVTDPGTNKVLKKVARYILAKN